MRKLRYLCVVLLLASLATLAVAQEQFTGEVVGVTDGDTIEVLRDGREVTVRLEGIDAPEDGDDFSNVAKRFTSGLVFGRVVSVRVKELDQYGRTVGRVVIDDQDVSLALVQAGLAWHYTEHSDDETLAAAERIAKTAGINIWSLPNPLPPWEVRALRALEQEQRVAPAPRTATPAPRPRAPTRSITYHGNRNSKIFHAPSCRYYACQNCTASFSSRDAAIRAGYRPCRICKP